MSSTSMDDYRKELWTGLKTGHEQFDRAMITLSSGGLALSLTVVKDLFVTNKLIMPSLLVSVWILFTLSIVVTVISFLTSQKGMSKQIEYFEKYAEGDETYKDKKNVFVEVTIWLNRISGGLFLVAVICLTVFSIINFNSKVKQYEQRTGANQEGFSTTSNANFTPNSRGIDTTSNAKQGGGIKACTNQPVTKQLTK